MTLARTLAFSLCVGIYLIACPLTIFYAFGYLMTPGGQQRFVKTGLIDVATAPPGAFVYLNNRRYTERTPTLLRGLLPGRYQVKLILKSYQPWSATVAVDAERATILDHILLLPLAPHPEMVLAGPCEELWRIPGTRFLLLKTGPRLGDVLLYDLEAERARPLVEIEEPFWRQARVVSHWVVRESPLVMFRVSAEDGDHLIRVELAGEAQPITDLTGVLPANPLTIVWEPRHPQQVFTLERGGALSHIDLTRLARAPQVVEGVRGVGLSRGTAYVLREDGSLQQIDGDAQRAELVLEAERGRAIFGPRGRVQIAALTKELLVFLGERGELLTNAPPYRVVDEGVRDVEFDQRRERALVWRKDKLGIMDAAMPRETGLTFAPYPRFAWVFEQGRDLAQAFWGYEGSHVVFRDQDAVWVLDLESPAQPPMSAQRLLAVRAGTDVCYVEESGTLYYLDQATGHLMALALLPKQTLSRRFLPERQNGETQSPVPQ